MNSQNRKEKKKRKRQGIYTKTVKIFCLKNGMSDT